MVRVRSRSLFVGPYFPYEVTPQVYVPDVTTIAAK